MSFLFFFLVSLFSLLKLSVSMTYSDITGFYYHGFIKVSRTGNNIDVDMSQLGEPNIPNGKGMYYVGSPTDQFGTGYIEFPGLGRFNLTFDRTKGIIAWDTETHHVQFTKNDIFGTYMGGEIIKRGASGQPQNQQIRIDMSVFNRPEAYGVYADPVGSADYGIGSITFPDNPDNPEAIAPSPGTYPFAYYGNDGNGKIYFVGKNNEVLYTWEKLNEPVAAKSILSSNNEMNMLPKEIIPSQSQSSNILITTILILSVMIILLLITNCISCTIIYTEKILKYWYSETLTHDSDAEIESQQLK